MSSALQARYWNLKRKAALGSPVGRTMTSAVHATQVLDVFLKNGLLGKLVWECSRRSVWKNGWEESV